ncbi:MULTISPECIES: hypothetical protein [unclassified Photobacterium]|uniref:hypothetical protein n=1 Tax=unclassified Photobacterium TaxID=2628852 RepID=UPI001EDD0892|nr:MULTISPECIES: hypothetical protein [unclassified Photobacterium]MCG3864541.1 hypothetical protein [Photobacterium sp. Ph6]MCG3876051.1 hypothetical protein [Photobacterium sp. Ph5]
MKMCVITSLISILLLVSFPSGARSVKQYMNQYSVIPCEGLKVKIESLEKRTKMILKVASDKTKKELKHKNKALSLLMKQKSCQ